MNNWKIARYYLRRLRPGRRNVERYVSGVRDLHVALDLLENSALLKELRASTDDDLHEVSEILDHGIVGVRLGVRRMESLSGSDVERKERVA